MRAVESPRRAQLLGALVLAGMFAAGVVFGVGIARWSSSSPQRLRPPPPPPGGPVDAMIHELDLDPDQVAALRSIEAAHRPQLDAIVQDTVPRVRDVLFAIEDDLRPKLRPDQIEKLEAWRKRRPPPPMPGMPPGGPPPPGAPPP